MWTRVCVVSLYDCGSCDGVVLWEKTKHPSPDPLELRMNEETCNGPTEILEMNLPCWGLDNHSSHSFKIKGAN